MQEAERERLHDAWTDALDAAAGEAERRARTSGRRHADQDVTWWYLHHDGQWKELEIVHQERHIASLDLDGQLDERARRRFGSRMAKQRGSRQYLWPALALVGASSFGLGVLFATMIR